MQLKYNNFEKSYLYAILIMIILISWSHNKFQKRKNIESMKEIRREEEKERKKERERERGTEIIKI